MQQKEVESSLFNLQNQGKSQKEREYSILKQLKINHSLNEQKNKLEHLEKSFDQIIKGEKKCNLSIQNKILEGIKYNLQQEIEAEKNLQQLIQKLSFRNVKQQLGDSDEWNFQRKGNSKIKERVSTISQRTQASENGIQSKQSSIFSAEIVNQNEKEKRQFQFEQNVYQNDEENQKQFLLDFKSEIRELENSLIQAKKERNCILEELEEQTDNLMDTKNYQKQLQLQNLELDQKIKEIQESINQLSKNGKLTNKNFVSMNALNQSKLNSSIIEDVTSKVKEISNFLKKKVLFWGQQEQNVQGNSQGAPPFTNRQVQTINILSEMN